MRSAAGARGRDNTGRRWGARVFENTGQHRSDSVSTFISCMLLNIAKSTTDVFERSRPAKCIPALRRDQKHDKAQDASTLPPTL
jgi:hypothetical protein